MIVVILKIAATIKNPKITSTPRKRAQVLVLRIQARIWYTRKEIIMISTISVHTNVFGIWTVARYLSMKVLICCMKTPNPRFYNTLVIFFTVCFALDTVFFGMAFT